MKDYLAQLVGGRPLSLEQTIEVFEQIMTGQAASAQIGALLAMIQQRGPTVEEITGAATVMRRKVTPVTVPGGLTVVDTCGTGGDHSCTFNISTASALVTAAAGRPHHIAVAKHGNRSITSQSGSSQVLEALGVTLTAKSSVLTQCLDRAGICFCFAPTHHPAMQHAMPIRMELGFRTLFNVLGPLTNPAGAQRQVIGVYDPQLTKPLACVLQALDSQHAMVVYGELSGRGIDELSTAGPTRISHLVNGQITTSQLDPQSLGFGTVDCDTLRVDSPQASAALIRRILGGEVGDPRDIVCLNAAAALVVAGVCEDLTNGLAQARQAIDSGAAGKTLDRLVELSGDG